mmetsp:Transcript_56880/g.166553  ORF Transcript_56880/g.166553 Transcript_56880/m.166553 type:complete len:273 (+) Transcript_56880:1377-2195(+)
MSQPFAFRNLLLHFLLGGHVHLYLLLPHFPLRLLFLPKVDGGLHLLRRVDHRTHQFLVLCVHAWPPFNILQRMLLDLEVTLSILDALYHRPDLVPLEVEDDLEVGVGAGRQLPELVQLLLYAAAVGPLRALGVAGGLGLLAHRLGLPDRPQHAGLVRLRLRLGLLLQLRHPRLDPPHGLRRGHRLRVEAQQLLAHEVLEAAALGLRARGPRVQLLDLALRAARAVAQGPVDLLQDLDAPARLQPLQELLHGGPASAPLRLLLLLLQVGGGRR